MFTSCVHRNAAIASLAESGAARSDGAHELRMIASAKMEVGIRAAI